MQKVQKADKQLSSGKAPSADCIPKEIFKEGGIKLREQFLRLYSNIRKNGEVPQDFKEALIIHIYKHKGDRAPVITIGDLTAISRWKDTWSHHRESAVFPCLPSGRYT